jgi:hypothetical protein
MRLPSRNRLCTAPNHEFVSRGLRDLSAWDVATFAELGKALTSSLQLDQALRVIMEKLDELFRADNYFGATGVC